MPSLVSMISTGSIRRRYASLRYSTQASTQASTQVFLKEKFGYGQNVAILDHAITKEGKIPDVEINRAIRRKEAFFHVPESHSYEEVL